MATQRLTKGNPAVFRWALTDNDGVTVLPDIATLTEIVFHARVAGQEGTLPTPELELKLSTDPTQFTLNTPALGSLEVKGLNADMAFNSEEFDTFLKVTRVGGEVLEYDSKVSDDGGFVIEEDAIA